MNSNHFLFLFSVNIKSNNNLKKSTSTVGTSLSVLAERRRAEWLVEIALPSYPNSRYHQHGIKINASVLQDAEYSALNVAKHLSICLTLNTSSLIEVNGITPVLKVKHVLCCVGFGVLSTFKEQAHYEGNLVLLLPGLYLF